MAAVEVIQVPEFSADRSGSVLASGLLGHASLRSRPVRSLADRRAARVRMMQRRRRTLVALLLVWSRDPFVAGSRLRRHDDCGDCPRTSPQFGAGFGDGRTWSSLATP